MALALEIARAGQVRGLAGINRQVIEFVLPARLEMANQLPLGVRIIRIRATW